MVYYLIESIYDKMLLMVKYRDQSDEEKALELMIKFPELFNLTDWVYGTVTDYKKGRIKRAKNEDEKINSALRKIKIIRNIIHLNYDICYKTSSGYNIMSKEEYTKCYQELTDNLLKVKGYYENKIHRKNIVIEELKQMSYCDLEVLNSLNNEIKSLYSEVIKNNI